MLFKHTSSSQNRQDQVCEGSPECCSLLGDYYQDLMKQRGKSSGDMKRLHTHIPSHGNMRRRPANARGATVFVGRRVIPRERSDVWMFPFVLPVCLLLACLLSRCWASNDVTPTVTTCLLCLSVLLFPFLPICLPGCLSAAKSPHTPPPSKTFHISKVLFFFFRCTWKHRKSHYVSLFISTAGDELKSGTEEVLVSHISLSFHSSFISSTSVPFPSFHPSSLSPSPFFLSFFLKKTPSF